MATLKAVKSLQAVAAAAGGYQSGTGLSFENLARYQGSKILRYSYHSAALAPTKIVNFAMC